MVDHKTKQEFLDKIAPCSLMCHTCGAYHKGVICEAAQSLFKYMEGVREFYKKNSPGKGERFEIFYEELENYNLGKCSGCRNREHHNCSIQNCFILECTNEHKVDFCGECAVFPCVKTKELFEEEVYMQWLDGNNQIKSNGIESYWERNCTKPHYKNYINE